MNWKCPSCGANNPEHWLSCPCLYGQRPCPGCGGELEFEWGDIPHVAALDARQVQLTVHDGTVCKKCGPPLGETFRQALEQLAAISGEQIAAEQKKADELLEKRKTQAKVNLMMLSIAGAAALGWGIHTKSLATGPAVFGYAFFLILFWATIYFGFELHAKWSMRVPCIAFYLDKGIDPGDGNSDVGGGSVRYVDLMYRAPDKKLRITRIPNLRD